MSVSSPKLEVYEGTAGILRATLEPHIQLQPHRNTLDALERVLLDGRSATSGLPGLSFTSIVAATNAISDAAGWADRP
jgi:hypothetical protein